jgi:hypothetical protein
MLSSDMDMDWVNLCDRLGRVQNFQKIMGWVGFGIETDRISVSVTAPKLA